MYRNKKLAIFDLDGVLLNSRANMEVAWQAVRSGLGVTTPFDDYFALIGRPFKDIMALLNLSAVAAEAERIFRMTSMEGIKLASFYNGVVPTLETLSARGWSLAVVTSKDKLRTGAILATLPVEFASIQTPEPRFRGKPAPDHLLLAMAEAKHDPAESFYVGDMDADYEAARRAGIDYVHASWGYGIRPNDQCLALDQFTDLLKITGVERS